VVVSTCCHLLPSAASQPPRPPTIAPLPLSPTRNSHADISGSFSPLVKDGIPWRTRTGSSKLVELNHVFGALLLVTFLGTVSLTMNVERLSSFF
jgi:hypothetical protein